MIQTTSSARTTCHTAGLAGAIGRKSATIGNEAMATASIDMVSGATDRQPNSAAVSAWTRSNLRR